MMISKSVEFPKIPQGMMARLEVLVPYVNDDNESAWYSVVSDSNGEVDLLIDGFSSVLWLKPQDEEMMWLDKDDLASQIAEWLDQHEYINFEYDQYDVVIIPAFPSDGGMAYTLVFHPYGYLLHLEQKYFKEQTEFWTKRVFQDFLHLLKCLDRTADAALLASLGQIPANFYNDFIAE